MSAFLVYVLKMRKGDKLPTRGNWEAYITARNKEKRITLEDFDILPQPGSVIFNGFSVIQHYHSKEYSPQLIIFVQ